MARSKARKGPKRPVPTRNDEEVQLVHPLEWRDAEMRLNLIEAAGRRAVSGTGPLNMRIVTPVMPVPKPVLLPGRLRSTLYGPDGRMLEDPTP
jgi:hypothetical protein